MNIQIKIPYDTSIVIPASANSGQLLQSLSEASLVREEIDYSGPNKFLIVDDKRIEVAFLPPDFSAEIPNPIKDLTDKVKSATDNWLEEYRKREASDKKVKELEEKLKSISEAVEP